MSCLPSRVHSFNMFYRAEKWEEGALMLQYESAPYPRCSLYTDRFSDRLPYSMQPLVRWRTFHSVEGVQGIWDDASDLALSQHKLDRVPIILAALRQGKYNILTDFFNTTSSLSFYVWIWQRRTCCLDNVWMTMTGDSE